MQTLLSDVRIEDLVVGDLVVIDFRLRNTEEDDTDTTLVCLHHLDGIVESSTHDVVGDLLGERDW